MLEVIFLGVPTRSVGVCSGNGGTFTLPSNRFLFVGSHNGFGFGCMFTQGSNDTTAKLIIEGFNNSGWNNNTISFSKNEQGKWVMTNNASSSMSIYAIC